MRVGIYTRYHACEATYAALRLADWASQHGCTVSLFCESRKTPAIHPHWDSQVRRDGPRAFTNWLRDQDVVCWTNTPIPGQLSWARAQGKRSILLPLWHDLRITDRDAYQLADVVLSPSQAAADLLQGQWEMRKCVVCPWDAGVPLTAKDSLQTPNRYRLLLPLYDKLAFQRHDGRLFQLCWELLDENQAVDLTVAINANWLSAQTKRYLQSASKRYGQRLRMVKPTLTQRPLLYSQHDLLLWPTLAENTGMTALTSIAMGTPVLGFNPAPVSEFLTGQNSFLLACDTEPNDLFVPTGLADYDNFANALHHLVSHQCHIEQLQKTVLTGLATRSVLFDAACQQAFLPD